MAIFVPPSDNLKRLLKEFLDHMDEFGFSRTRLEDIFSDFTSWRSNWTTGRLKLPAQHDKTKRLIAIVLASNNDQAGVADDADPQDWIVFTDITKRYTLAPVLLEHLREYKYYLSKLMVDGSHISPTEFPDHIENWIVELARNSTELYAYCDAADYGSFRDFEAHRRLVDAIGMKGENAHILLCHKAEALSAMNKYAYPNYRKENTLEFQSVLRSFLANIKDHLSPPGQSNELWQEVSGHADGLDHLDRWHIEDSDFIRALHTLQDDYHETIILELQSKGVEVKVFQPHEDLQIDPNRQFFWIGKRSGWRGARLQCRPSSDGMAYPMDQEDISRNVEWLLGELKRCPCWKSKSPMFGK